MEHASETEVAEDLRADLTPAQRQVVEHRDGPLLVLAGPGSGKTRVVTRRIARLVEQGVSPRSILAITFTNKAADEMRQRVDALLPGTQLWVSTFHRFCARLLRRYADVVGLRPNFSILDASDQKQALRNVLHELDYDAVAYPPERIGHRISAAKNDLVTAELYARRFQESVADHWQAVVARVYPAYQNWLTASNAVDFDDLLLHTATMLIENEELRAELDSRYRYVLVDEYQDTNRSQYQIVAALSQQHPNLCVTGDPDQSIYGWRGARIENILRFERDYPQAKVVRLEENFRSTKAILRSADQLIAHNRLRKAKQLLTANEEGEAVQLLTFADEAHEADALARHLKHLVEEQGLAWSDCAVFMRVNALSRQIEHACVRHRIPFQVAAGAAFYDRAEIKDMLAYLRLVHNPADRAAFARVINSPARGLGATSQQRLLHWAAGQGLTPLEACARAAEVPKLSRRAVLGFVAFGRMLSDCSLANAGSVADLLARVIDRTEYTRAWEGSPLEKDQDRLANVQELVSAARQFDDARGEDTTLEGFLEQTALVNETDAIDDSRGLVTLMTLHAAKGLEFPVVYILGVEQGLIPHERATREGDGRELEEERRLLFVGMTRARQRLFLTQTRQRAFRGRTLHTIPSDFLDELEYTPLTIDTSHNPPPAWLSVTRGDAAAARDRLREFGAKPLLTTGADLLRGTSSAAPLPLGFPLGSQVRHPRYGLGTVVDVGGFGPRRTVTVSFSEGDRTEKFIASQSPLQPVGNGSP